MINNQFIKILKDNNVEVKIIKLSEGRQLNVLGDNQVVKFTAKETGNLLTTVTQNNPPGTQIPPHLHDNEDEVYHIIEGEIEFAVGSKKEILTVGDSIFLPRGIAHSFKVVGTSNAKTILNIFPGGLEDMFEELSALPAGSPDLAKAAGICAKFGVHFI